MALLDAPARGRVSTGDAGDGTRRRGAPSLRRDPVSDLAPDLREELGSRRGPRGRAAEFDSSDTDSPASPRQGGLRLKVRARFPRSVVGRTILSILGLTGLGALAYGLHLAQVAVLHDTRLVIPSSSAVQISGNNHLTRAQLLSVFGEDVDRNLLTVPLVARRAELESLPWVEHATVMRLLPNHLRVAIQERTPVAFIRQGSQIGLVDAHGVLLDLSPELAADHAYSFPVLTGIASSDPASVRTARMKLYLKFTGDLDAGTEKISKKLSEVDLTDPEDVKALIPDQGTDLLVHFGDADFLPRYRRYEQNLADWKTKYPSLASVDMRYEHSVVLQMAPGAAVPIAGAADQGEASGKPAALAKRPVPGKKPAVKPLVKAKAAVTIAPPAAASPMTVLPTVGHLQQSFDVKPKAKPAKAGPQ
jgi:cell division protein FtsQ